MTKKTFRNTYKELYLITKEVYDKVMSQISNRADKDKTTELNPSISINDSETANDIRISKPEESLSTSLNEI